MRINVLCKMGRKPGRAMNPHTAQPTNQQMAPQRLGYDRIARRQASEDGKAECTSIAFVVRIWKQVRLLTWSYTPLRPLCVVSTQHCNGNNKRSNSLTSTAISRCGGQHGVHMRAPQKMALGRCTQHQCHSGSVQP